MGGIADKSLHFGQQNFFFVDSSEEDGTYDYVSYVNRRGTILIARFPKDGSAARYVSKSGTYTTIWAARTTYTYVLPNQLVDMDI